MKVMHLGDLHIGKSLGDFDLIGDQKYILDQILDLALAHKVDGVLIAGDIYDKSVPSEAAVGLFDYFINRLVSENIRIYAITGNHDSDERLNFGSGLFEAREVYISAKYRGRLQKIEFQDDFGKVNVYLMPFIKASQVKHYYPEEEIRDYDQAVRVAIEKSQIKPEERNILVAHQFVAGRNRTIELAGSEGLAARNVGLVEQISYENFDMFNYVALGHIHAPQRIGRDEIRYSGSPLKYSLAECNKTKSVPIVTLEEKGQVQIELVHLKPMRDLRHIKGKLAQLLDRENIRDPEDFMYITLTDEEIVENPMGIFQQYYPNTVRIDYDNSHTKGIDTVDLVRPTEKKSFQEMISEFYELMYGCPISDSELKMMKTVAKEAGIEDETD